MIICPNCGADMRFDPTSLKLVCDYCRTSFEPSEFQAWREEHMDELAQGEEQEAFSASTYICSQCGAEIITTEETAVTFCSYCGASVMLKGRLSRKKRPDLIIPFSVNKEQCEEQYRKMLKRSPFVPSDMKSDTQIEKFRGIYMPYWCYSFTNKDKVRIEGQKVTQDGDYELTQYYELTIPADMIYEGFTHDASSQFFDNLSDSIAPFESGEAVDFDPLYLSGFYADLGDVDADTYLEDAEDMAAGHAAMRIYDSDAYDEYGISRSDIEERLDFYSEKHLGMFPVWFLATRDSSGQRVSYAVVNGQTGKVSADLPIDFGKYFAASLLLAVPLFILFNTFVNLNPENMLICCAAMAFTSICISWKQMDRIFTSDTHLNDNGLRAVGTVDAAGVKLRERNTAGASFSVLLKVMGKTITMLLLYFLGLVLCVGLSEMLIGLPLFAAWFFGFPIYGIKKVFQTYKEEKKDFRNSTETLASEKFTRKFLRSIKQISAFVMCAAVYDAKLVDDRWYYLTAVAAMLLIILSFRDIIREQNQLTRRKISLLGKRGGDENA